MLARKHKVHFISVLWLSIATHIIAVIATSVVASYTASVSQEATLTRPAPCLSFLAWVSRVWPLSKIKSAETSTLGDHDLQFVVGGFLKYKRNKSSVLANRLAWRWISFPSQKNWVWRLATDFESGFPSRISGIIKLQNTKLDQPGLQEMCISSFEKWAWPVLACRKENKELPGGFAAKLF